MVSCQGGWHLFLVCFVIEAEQRDLPGDCLVSKTHGTATGRLAPYRYSDSRPGDTALDGAADRAADRGTQHYRTERRRGIAFLMAALAENAAREVNAPGGSRPGDTALDGAADRGTQH